MLLLLLSHNSHMMLQVRPEETIIEYTMSTRGGKKIFRGKRIGKLMREEEKELAMSSSV